MTVIPGTDFYLWTGYGALAVLAFLIGLILRARVRQTDPVAARPSGKPVLVSLLAFGFCFFAYLFFSDFYGIECRSDQVRLVYPWPRPAVIIETASIEKARIRPPGRNPGGSLGSLEITARGKVYGSTSIYTREVMRYVKSSLPISTDGRKS